MRWSRNSGPEGALRESLVVADSDEFFSPGSVPSMPSGFPDRVRIRFYALMFLFRSGSGYTRNVFANAIKRLAGRAPFFDATECFFRLYMLYRLGLGRPPTITSRGLPREGAGSQARHILCAISFARALRLPYAHTPFREIDRADRPMKDWASAWEDEFNLGAGERLALPGAHDLDFASVYNAFVERFGSRELFSIIGLTAQDFRAKYYRDKQCRTNAILSVAVHLRRGDVEEYNSHGRWAGIAGVVAVTRRVDDILTGRGIAHRISVFSEGDSGSFRAFGEFGERAELYLNRDAIWTMRQMVEADVLIMGKGYFSYVAALISDGIRIYDPWLDIPTLRGWLVREPDGRFDQRAFIGELEKTLRVGGRMAQ